MSSLPSLLRRCTWCAVLPVALLSDGCSRAGDDGDDTASAAAVTATRDSGMSGPERGAEARSAPRDSNQAFLRMMSDHHQGLIALVDTARPKLGTAAQADADKLSSKQKSEQQHMLMMLHGEYTDSITPVVIPSNQTMIQAVANASAGDADRVFYQQVIAHHREGIGMTDRMLPQLSGMTRDMAQKARTDQQREITEFEKKAGGGAR